MKVLALLALLVISSGCSLSNSAGSQVTNKNVTAPTPSQPVTASETSGPCPLKLSDAPVIDDLKLGITSDQVLALFPGSKDAPDVKSDLTRPVTRFGGSSLVIRPGNFEPKEKYAGVNQITFNFLDGKVSSFNIGYAGPEYPHVDKFVEVVTSRSNLPSVEHWEPYVGMDNQLKILKCTEFEVRVYAGGPGGSLNYVLVNDLVADKKLKERRAKAREQASPTP
jgi:hypothetical protein